MDKNLIKTNYMFYTVWTAHTGAVHRTDGPAIIWDDDEIEWFIYGKKYLFDEWLEANDEISEEQKVMLKLQYG